jgi:hypothetical protein
MGFSPQQVDRMSMWQFLAALNGYVKANSGGKEALTEAEKDDLWAWIDTPANDRLLSTPVYWWDERGPVMIKRVTFRA